MYNRKETPKFCYSVIKYWEPNMDLHVGQTEVGLGLILSLIPWLNSVLCQLLTSEVNVFLTVYHNLEQDNLALLLCALLCWLEKKAIKQTSQTVFVCLIQYYKSDILCIGNHGSFHLQRTTQTQLSCWIAWVKVSFSMSSVMGDMKAQRWSDLCQWVSGRVETRAWVGATRVHYFPLTCGENG